MRLANRCVLNHIPQVSGHRWLDTRASPDIARLSLGHFWPVLVNNDPIPATKTCSMSPPLVMIHGLMGSLNFFSAHERIPALVVHTPDLMGYGEEQDTPFEAITLASQTAHVVRYLREVVVEPCVLLGHSVGGAIAMLVARAAPDCVRGIINVEGNFTLEDAFWCRKIAALPTEDWHEEHRQLVGNPEAWLTNAGIAITPQRLEWARLALANQPHETIQPMAHAVVVETDTPDYMSRIRPTIESGTRLSLLAGARSASGWHMPDWAGAAALEYVEQKDTGHMMMLEDPDEFCRIVADMAGRINEASLSASRCQAPHQSAIPHKHRTITS